MLVAGASRHAKEILELLHQQNQLDNLQFFDDINREAPDLFYERFPIVKSIDDLHNIFKTDNRFVLGLGGTKARAVVAEKLIKAGGHPHSVIAESARVGHYHVSIGKGVNIMELVLITNSVTLGEGCLINAFSAIHHDVTVGCYCEISPRATLLGGASIGNFSSVGSGAIILPNVKVGSHVIIGAGSVVTRDVPDNCTVVGVPGKVIRKAPSSVS
ncbi:MAG: acetyltransferase [Cyclobacteriaceae bacterium]|nr:acetyltransferase [Cyclobacteriaceae bacterium]